MKKMMTSLVVTVLLVGFGQTARSAGSTTEAERYWAYQVACLEQIKAGGVLNGMFYDSAPGAKQIGSTQIGFTEQFRYGKAQAIVRLDPGWYQAGCSWEEPVYREQLYRSVYVEQTYFGAGLQAMPFLMYRNDYRSVRLTFSGSMPSDSDQVWFGGMQAWRDGNVWRACVYKPWNVIDTDAEVIWVGHGGWVVPVVYDSFVSGINLPAEKMIPTLLSPTKVKTVSLPADSYLDDENLVQYVQQFYSPDLGCNALELKVGPDVNIAELTVVLSGLDQGSGARVSYKTAYLENVSGTFLVPLGDTGILPQTNIRVYLINPATGEYAWQYLQNDLWYDVNGGGGGVGVCVQ